MSENHHNLLRVCLKGFKGLWEDEEKHFVLNYSASVSVEQQALHFICQHHPDSKVSQWQHPQKQRQETGQNWEKTSEVTVLGRKLYVRVQRPETERMVHLTAAQQPKANRWDSTGAVPGQVSKYPHFNPTNLCGETWTWHFTDASHPF